MSYVVMPKADWQNILNSVRAKTGKSGALVSGAVPAEIDSIGGMDEFWDKLQANGSRRVYLQAFSGWNSDLFHPKYDLICTNEAQFMFAYWGNYHSCPQVDLAARLNACGVTLDLSAATNTQNLFYRNLALTRIPDLNLSGANTTYAYDGMFYRCENVQTIGKLTFNPNMSFVDGTFYHLDSLQNITIEPGTIGKSLKFQHSSKLTPESIESIIYGLSDDVTGQTCSINSTAVNNIISEWGSHGWISLVQSKPNWTITTV